MLGSERRFGDRERPQIKRLGFVVAALCIVEPTEVVEARSDVRVLPSVRLLGNGNGPEIELLSFGVATLGVI